MQKLKFIFGIIVPKTANNLTFYLVFLHKLIIKTFEEIIKNDK